MTADTTKSSQEIANIPLAPRASDIWEVDFYSRPVLGLDGKKLWELIITDSSGAFEHVESIPNSLVNSRELRARIEAVINDAQVKPVAIRFFRVQMRNMIQIALSELDVQVRPSRRTYALFQMIKYREQNVYPNMPGYKESLARQPISFVGVDLNMTERLPDALRCDSFSFAYFPLGQLEEFFSTANRQEFFGDQCLVDSSVPQATLIPGLVIYSSRSAGIAGWISGIELATIQAKVESLSILIECGLDKQYKFASISKEIQPEAAAFQSQKSKADGLHFLAVQKNEASDEVDGLWLLRDL